MKSWLAVVLLGVVTSAPAWAGPADLDGPPFRVEWSASETSTGVRLQGWVYNDSRYTVTNVRLHIESMDGEGRATAQTFRWVFGDVPAGGRTDFAVPELPVAPSYRVTVIWFDRVTLTRP